MRQKEKSKRKSLPKSKPLGLYLFLMFTIFPLFCTDGYFHIRLDRYYFFLWTLLRVDDRWGTLRGFIWKRSFLLFGDFSLKEKLLGSGPDTYYGVFSHNFAELIQLGGNAADAAHNEYLNYLITQGLVGLGAWLTLLVSNLVHALRGMKTDPMYAVFAAAVIGCSAQAMVNIAQPITTPLMILFIALCGAKIPLTSTKGPSRAYHKKR